MICYYACERTRMAWTHTSVVTCGSKSGYQKNIVSLKEIRLHVKNIIIF